LGLSLLASACFLGRGSFLTDNLELFGAIVFYAKYLYHVFFFLFLYYRREILSVKKEPLPNFVLYLSNNSFYKDRYFIKLLHAHKTANAKVNPPTHGLATNLWRSRMFE
jgi:hypothetical protein